MCNKNKEDQNGSEEKGEQEGKIDRKYISPWDKLRIRQERREERGWLSGMK